MSLETCPLPSLFREPPGQCVGTVAPWMGNEDPSPEGGRPRAMVSREGCDLGCGGGETRL